MRPASVKNFRFFPAKSTTSLEKIRCVERAGRVEDWAVGGGAGRRLRTTEWTRCLRRAAAQRGSVIDARRGACGAIAPAAPVATGRAVEIPLVDRSAPYGRTAVGPRLSVGASGRIVRDARCQGHQRGHGKRAGIGERERRERIER